MVLDLQFPVGHVGTSIIIAHFGKETVYAQYGSAQLAKSLKEEGVKQLNLSLDTLGFEKYAYITWIGQMEMFKAVASGHAFY